MKRRKFLKSTGLLTVTASAMPALASCNSSHGKVKMEYYTGCLAPTSMETLENDFLKFELFSDSSAKILDKKNNQEWNILSVAIQDEGPIEMNHTWQRVDRAFMEEFPARFVLERSGAGFTATMLGRQNSIKGRFSFNVSLDEKWLRYEITHVDQHLTSLVFPPPVQCESLVIPMGAGRHIKYARPDIFTRSFLSFAVHLNMKWIGGLKGDNGWIGVYDYDCNDGGALLVNSLIAPTWLPSMGRWNKPCRIGYRFTSGGYVGIAKVFRQYAIERGMFRSLKEKIDENRLLENLIGGRTLTYFEAFPALRKDQAAEYWYTEAHMAQRKTDGLSIDFKHEQVSRSIRYARKIGFNRGAVVVRGWLNGGYDGLHPDVWPPDPALGTIDELKEIMNLGGDILYGLHDNYQDMYDNSPSFPKGINIRNTGELMNGGFWAGGQAYILNSRDSVRYAKRNWGNCCTLGQGMMFIDTTAANRFLESYEEGNRLDKTQDKEYRLLLLKFFREQGMVVGSEEGSDYTIPVTDFYECRHNRKPGGETIPLWALVFHDAAVMSRYISFEPGSPYPKWLEDMLWGYQLQFFMTPRFGNINPGAPSERIGFGANEFSEELFKSTFHVDQWHKQIGTAEMLSHRFLTDDFMVEESVFAPGKRIIVNFSDKNRIVEGIRVNKHGYIIV